MKSKTLFIIIVSICALIIRFFVTNNSYSDQTSNAAAYQMSSDSSNAVYTCPMHSDVISDMPGKCPKCGMYLVLKTDDGIDNSGMKQNGDCSNMKDCKGMSKKMNCNMSDCKAGSECCKNCAGKDGCDMKDKKSGSKCCADCSCCSK